MAKIFDLTFTEKNQTETIDYVYQMLQIENTTLMKHIITANPEIVMKSSKDKEIKRILQNADLITPDGIGVVIAGKLFKENITERVTGFDTTVGLFEKFEKEKKRLNIFMLGASQDVLSDAVKNIENKYNYVKVVGFRNGYFNESEKNKIIDSINDSKADLLLVALGFPRQEQFIYENKTKLDTKVAIGVGGTFDVLSGHVKRAPKWVQKIHLEWMYRLLKQPKRIMRQTSLFKFGFIVLLKKLKKDY